MTYCKSTVCSERLTDSERDVYIVLGIAAIFSVAIQSGIQWGIAKLFYIF